MSTITDLETTTTGVDTRPIINTNFDNLNTDKAEVSGTTFTGKVDFSGTTHAGIELNSLTTTQRDALTPVNGDVIYNTTTTQVEFYENGSWVSLSGVSDASVTVKGIVEEATEAEVVAGTAAGGTLARLFVNPTSISAKILTDVERTFVRALTADATEVNQLDGTTNIAEADTFFGATDMSGAEAETLTDGSDADALHVHTYAEKGVVDSSQVVVDNTTTETSLGSFSLAGGELSTNNGVHIKIPVSSLTTLAAGGHTFTLKLKYGATTVATATLSPGAGGLPDAKTGYIEAYLMASGATGTQKGTLELYTIEDGSFNNSGSASYARSFATGTATEDSTGALTVDVTAQFNTANASDQIYTEGFIATIIK
jgi:hypothetical protein